MTRLKKISSLILALLMVLAISGSAFAASDNSLTVENTGKTAHTFELYQIFKGDVVEGQKTLSNVTWGSGVKDSQGDSAQKVESLKSLEEATKFAKEIQEKLQNPVESKAVAAGEKYTFDGLEAGYYLVKDKAQSQNDGENSAYTTYILKVVGKVEAKTKLDVPSVEKHVKDINNSQDTEMKDWAKTADHDIGDKVAFKLTGSLPTNFDEYETYKYVFHDEMSAGLTFDKASLVVKVDDLEIKEGFTLEEKDGGFSLTFEDLKKLDGVKSTSKIIVEYEAELNEKAILGSSGNPNEVYLEYSNNPNQTGDGEKETGKTPKDKVIVFTYKTVINKVDEDKKALKGAAFKLEKFDATKDDYVLVREIKVEDTTSFEFKGLDDGKYRLTETKTPAGYNTIKPVEFTIVASHDDKDLSLKDLNGNSLEGSIDLSMTADKDAGSLSADVVNKKGAELPETGGRGTKLIYALGVLLVLGGVSYLLQKRKFRVQ